VSPRGSGHSTLQGPLPFGSLSRTLDGGAFPRRRTDRRRGARRSSPSSRTRAEQQVSAGRRALPGPHGRRRKPGAPPQSRWPDRLGAHPGAASSAGRVARRGAGAHRAVRALRRRVTGLAELTEGELRAAVTITEQLRRLRGFLAAAGTRRVVGAGALGEARELPGPGVAQAEASVADLVGPAVAAAERPGAGVRQLSQLAALHGCRRHAALVREEAAVARLAVVIASQSPRRRRGACSRRGMAAEGAGTAADPQYVWGAPRRARGFPFVAGEAAHIAANVQTRCLSRPRAAHEVVPAVVGALAVGGARLGTETTGPGLRAWESKTPGRSRRRRQGPPNTWTAALRESGSLLFWRTCRPSPTERDEAAHGAIRSSRCSPRDQHGRRQKGQQIFRMSGRRDLLTEVVRRVRLTERMAPLP